MGNAVLPRRHGYRSLKQAAHKDIMITPYREMDAADAEIAELLKRLRLDERRLLHQDRVVRNGDASLSRLSGFHP